jgi:hypothetical protein
VLAAVNERSTPAEAVDALQAALAMLVCGWQNMGRDYTPAALTDLLTLDEMCVLLQLARQAILPTEADRGNSSSPSPNSAASSAVAAGAAAA